MTCKFLPGLKEQNKHVVGERQQTEEHDMCRKQILTHYRGFVPLYRLSTGTLPEFSAPWTVSPAWKRRSTNQLPLCGQNTLITTGEMLVTVTVLQRVNTHFTTGCLWISVKHITSHHIYENGMFSTDFKQNKHIWHKQSKSRHRLTDKWLTLFCVLTDWTGEILIMFRGVLTVDGFKWGSLNVQGRLHGRTGLTERWRAG